MFYEFGTPLVIYLSNLPDQQAGNETNKLKQITQTKLKTKQNEKHHL